MWTSQAHRTRRDVRRVVEDEEDLQPNDGDLEETAKLGYKKGYKVLIKIALRVS